eukprot:gene17341-biopygen15891
MPKKSTHFLNPRAWTSFPQPGLSARSEGAHGEAHARARRASHALCTAPPPPPPAPGRAHRRQAALRRGARPPRRCC